MSEPLPKPAEGDGGDLIRSLKTALDLFDDAFLGIVAASRPRLDDLRDPSSEVIHPPERIKTCLAAASGSALEETLHHIVIPDESVDPADRGELLRLAKQSFPRCKVIEIRRWAQSPPL